MTLKECVQSALRQQEVSWASCGILPKLTVQQNKVTKNARIVQGHVDSESVWISIKHLGPSSK